MINFLKYFVNNQFTKIIVFFFFKPGKCAYVVAIMAIYWMTEAIPMAATALIPFAFMPWLGIIKASEIATSYLKVKCIQIFEVGLLIPHK